MSTNKLIHQYVTTGQSLPEEQVNKLKTNHLKSYLRQRLIAHKTPNADKYRLKIFEIELVKKFGGNVDFSFYDIANVDHHDIIDKYVPEKFNISAEDLNDRWTYYDYELLKIVKGRPELANKVNDERISMMKDYIGSVLEIWPNKDKLFSPEDYANLNNTQIGELLKVKPNYYNLYKNKFSNLPSYMLEAIAVEQPKLFDKVFQTNKVRLNSISYKLEDEIVKDPKKAKLYPTWIWEEFPRYVFSNIVEKQPKVVAYLPKKMISNLDKYDIQKIIIKAPKTVKYFNEYLSGADDYALSNMILSEPKLLKPLSPYLDGLNKYYALDIIKNVPASIEYIQNKLDGWDLEDLLIEKPRLYSKLNDESKAKLGEYQISSILKNNPKSAKYLGELINKLDNPYRIEDILERQPKLAPYFKEVLHKIDPYDYHDIRKKFKIDTE